LTTGIKTFHLEGSRKARGHLRQYTVPWKIGSYLKPDSAMSLQELAWKIGTPLERVKN